MALGAGRVRGGGGLAAVWMERRLRPAPAASTRPDGLAGGDGVRATCSSSGWRSSTGRNGVFLRWHMPDQHWGFAFYLDALVLMAVGFGANRASPGRLAGGAADRVSR